MKVSTRARQRRGLETEETKEVTQTPRRGPEDMTEGDNVKKAKREVSTVFSLFACMMVLIVATVVVISLFDERNVFEIIVGDGSGNGIDTTNTLLYMAKEDVPKAISTKDAMDNYFAKYIDATEHDYDWGKLRTEGAYKFYDDAEKGSSRMGIDVSYHQDKINWKKVKEAGIDFAIIRIGYRGYKSGKIVMDECYKANIKGATEAGLDVGLYFFTQAVNEKEAVEEAEFVLKNIGDYKIVYPIVIDTEAIGGGEGRSHAADLTTKELTNICKAFCDRVNKAGYKSSIYASKSWFINNLDLESLEGYSKWLAHYTEITDYPFEFDIWQYTESGSVDGIKGRVDLNMSLTRYDNKE